MNQNYRRIGEFAINFDAIRYIKRVERESGFYFYIYFIGPEECLAINEENPEWKALLYWWQNVVRAMPDGADELANLYASS